MPKVSIIIATHNRPQLLQRAINSAFKASMDVEVIVVDDASNDETAEVCRAVKGIKYIRIERNQKTAGARNLGILASTAPYIAFLDDDDWRLPNSLDWQVSLLDENPEYGLIYGKYFLANQKGELLNDLPIPWEMSQGDLFYRLIEGCIFGCLTVVFRKKCIYEVGMLDANIPGIDDWDLWVRIAELYPILALEHPVAVWRKAEVRSNQGSSNVGNNFRLAVKTCNEKWSQLPRAKENPKIISKSKGNLCKSASNILIMSTIMSCSNKISKLSDFYAAIKIYPQIVTTLHFYKTLAKVFGVWQR